MEGVTQALQTEQMDNIEMNEAGDREGSNNLPLDNESPDSRFRVFRARHIQMMALGISDFGGCNWRCVRTSSGIGVLFESGTLLFLGGPVCLVLAYLWAGSVLYAMMVNLRKWPVLILPDISRGNDIISSYSGSRLYLSKQSSQPSNCLAFEFRCWSDRDSLADTLISWVMCLIIRAKLFLLQSLCDFGQQRSQFLPLHGLLFSLSSDTLQSFQCEKIRRNRILAHDNQSDINCWIDRPGDLAPHGCYVSKSAIRN